MKHWRQVSKQRLAPPTSLLHEATTSVGLMDGPALVPIYNYLLLTVGKEWLVLKNVYELMAGVD